jgi:Ca-activated chloride channel family protein
MLAKDVQPSRFERAILEMERLMDELDGDRIGIVNFSGVSFTQCPLTTDRGAAKVFLRAVKADSLPIPGTAISDALNRSAKLLESGTSPSRVVILLTDGEDTSGDADAAIAEMKKRGTTVFTIGVGKPAGEPIPAYSEGGAFQGYRKDSGGKVVLSRLDTTLLSKLAVETGGDYVNLLQDPDGPSRIAARIAGMKKGEMKSKVVTIYAEKFQYLLFAGLFLLCLEAALGERKRNGV